MATQQYWQQQRNSLEKRITTLTNDELKTICRAYGYQVSGIKSTLQKRCLEVLNDKMREGDEASMIRLKYRIENRGREPPNGQANSYGGGGGYNPQSHFGGYNMAAQRGGGGLSMPNSDKLFKSSPFNEILATLVPLQEMRDGPDMPQNRHTVTANLTITPEQADRFRRDSLKVLLYCGELSSLQAYPNTPSHITFPPQVDVRVNDSEVKSNFKGLKNKPGSTKPADLTAFIRKYKGEPNTIQVTYALTTRKFAYTVYLVRYSSPEKLTDRVKQQRVIRKQKVLDAMSRANADPDIAATSIRMSLKDPVSTIRITVPIRSSNCQHNQCFDSTFYMQMQEQAPTWNCPICNKNTPFETLCVDEYFQEILEKTPVTTEKVEIEPNGHWKIIKDENDDDDDDQPNGASNKRARASYDDDFEDLVELDQPDNKKINGVKRESLASNSSPMGGAPINLTTPPVPSRETSAPRSGSKRPQSAVIDLTLSDDDEDEPPRPAKRQFVHRPSHSNSNSQSNRNSYATPNSIPDASRYQAQNRTQPPPQQQQHQQDNSFRPSTTHNQPPRPSFTAPSMSPPYQPSPAMQTQPNWSPSPLTTNFHRNSATPSYPSINNNNNNSPMYPPPASPIAHRPPPPQPAPSAYRDHQQQRDTYYQPPPPNNHSGYNHNTHTNNSAWSPRQGQPPAQQGGLRLPPLSAGSSSDQGQNGYGGNEYGGSGYGGGWRNDYDYDYGGPGGGGSGNWSQSPHG